MEIQTTDKWPPGVLHISQLILDGTEELLEDSVKSGRTF